MSQGEYRIVTDEQILEALENKEPTETLSEVAVKLGYASVAGLSQRMSRMQDKIRDKSKEMIAKYSIQFIQDLLDQSKAGKTEATKIGLEITDVYTPKSKQDVKMDVTGLAQRMRKAETRVTEQKDKTDSEQT